TPRANARQRGWRVACFAAPAMTPVLVDPSLRRARIVRALSLVLVAVMATTIGVFCRGIRARGRTPFTLPSPRRGIVAARRAFRPERPERPGRRPKPGHASGHRAAAASPWSGPPDVIAYLDPSAPGALASLDRHADALAGVAV